MKFLHYKACPNCRATCTSNEVIKRYARFVCAVCGAIFQREIRKRKA